MKWSVTFTSVRLWGCVIIALLESTSDYSNDGPLSCYSGGCFLLIRITTKLFKCCSNFRKDY